VKAVMIPLAGQSFNPSAKAHLSVLKTVVAEEKTEIEKEKKLSLKQ
jgi:nicotinic acid mononucleotide adenylyltransferase